jgi:hypothetical protein
MFVLQASIPLYFPKSILVFYKVQRVSPIITPFSRRPRTYVAKAPAVYANMGSGWVCLKSLNPFMFA